MLKQLIIFLFCIISLLKPLIAEDYHSERYKYHVKLIDDWGLEVDARKKKVSMVHPEKLVTINVIGFYYPDTITANGLQKRRMGSIYDGWLNIFERSGTEKENDNAAVEESYIALYTKHQIDDKLKINEKMVAEYYYVRDQNAYVISLETYKEDWPSIQKTFKRLVKSFWVGEGDKPIPVISRKELPVGIENTQQGVSAENRRFIEANPELQMTHLTRLKGCGGQATGVGMGWGGGVFEALVLLIRVVFVAYLDKVTLCIRHLFVH